MKKLLNNPQLIFAVVITFLFVAADGPRILQYAPRSVHIWRQCDCLAYTKTYYQHNINFWTPTCYCLAGPGGRFSLAEFPILYYISAKLCQAFGFHYWIIRGISLLCYIMGLYYLLLISRMWIKNLLLALLPVVLLATTPIYFFYGVNFLPNVPAMSFAFGGLYYLLQFRNTKSRWQLVLSTLFFIMSMLLKPTDGGIMWVAGMGVMLPEFAKTKSGKSFIPLMLLNIALISICFLSWALYVHHYNTLYRPYEQPQTIYPIWSMAEAEIKYTFFTRFDYSVWTAFQAGSILCLMFALAIIYITRWRRQDPFLRKFIVWLLAGVVIYTALYFHQFSVHDYYQIIFSLPVVFMSISILHLYESSVAPRLNRHFQYGMLAVLAGIMLVGIYHNQAVQLDRYHDENYSFHNPAVFEAEPYLRRIGVTTADSVYAVPDNTPNISLAAFGNFGYTSPYLDIKRSIERGVKYLIITDAAYLHDSTYIPYTTKPIGAFKGIYVFDVSNAVPR